MTQMKVSFTQRWFLYFSSLYCFAQMWRQLWCEKDSIFGVSPRGYDVWQSFMFCFVYLFIYLFIYLFCSVSWSQATKKSPACRVSPPLKRGFIMEVLNNWVANCDVCFPNFSFYPWKPIKFFVSYLFESIFLSTQSQLCNEDCSFLNVSGFLTHWFLT